MSAGLIEEARRLASFAPEKPESVHDVVCAGFNELTEQLAARTRDFLAAVERNEEKDRRISDLEEQLQASQAAGHECREHYMRLEEQLDTAREERDLFYDRLQESREQYGTLRDAAQGLVSHLSLREPMQFKEQDGCDAWNALLDALGEGSSPAKRPT